MRKEKKEIKKRIPVDTYKGCQWEVQNWVCDHPSLPGFTHAGKGYAEQEIPSEIGGKILIEFATKKSVELKAIGNYETPSFGFIKKDEEVDNPNAPRCIAYHIFLAIKPTTWVIDGNGDIIGFRIQRYVSCDEYSFDEAGEGKKFPDPVKIINKNLWRYFKFKRHEVIPTPHPFSWAVGLDDQIVVCWSPEDARQYEKERLATLKEYVAQAKRDLNRFNRLKRFK